MKKTTSGAKNLMKLLKSKEKIFFVILLLLGLIYRLFLAYHAPSTFMYDSASYHRIAKAILQGNWAIDCCDHNPGYPLFLAAVYFIFGIGNVWAVRIVQILLDLAASCLIFQVGRSVFGRYAAWCSYILYIFNPFTSSYTGVLLAETITCFLIASIAYTVTRRQFIIKPLFWIVSGVLLGLLLQARVSATFFVYTMIASLALLFFSKTQKVHFIICISAGFIIGSSYSLLAYYRYFHRLALTPPYNLGMTMLYWNFYNDRYPELLVDFPKVNPEFARVLLEYHTTYFLKTPAFKKKYNDLFWKKIQSEWPLFVRNTFRNVVWIWDKDHLFVYTDRFYPQDRWTLRVTNIVLIVLFFTGFIKYSLNQKKKILQNPLVIQTSLLFISITFLFTLISNESRHSMAFYPLLLLWGGYGFVCLGNALNRRIKKTYPSIK